MRLFVARLPFGFTDGDLKELFSPFGTVVAAHVVIDGASGQSRGFGFVEIPSEAEAERAMTELDRKEIQGRAIVVEPAFVKHR